MIHAFDLHRPAALLAGLASLLLSACAVGPNFKTPAPPTTPGYVSGDLVSPTADAAAAQRFVQDQDIPGQWWTLFHSDQLNALIEAALKNSPTLAAAQAALREANENVAAQRGSYYPSASLAAESQRDRASGTASGIPGLPPSYFYTLDTATVTVSYTLDAFGGIRRQVEGLQAQADYERFALEASYLSLTANIVTAAVTEASLRAQIAATEDVVQSQQRQLDIISRRMQAGAASRTDFAQQQATVAATLATLPTLRTQLAQQRNQLATYVGVLPADYQGAEFSLDSLTLPDALPVSLPSKLVEQRPDVQEYTALLHQATAQIGVATANMLPQITLQGVAARMRAGSRTSSSPLRWSGRLPPRSRSRSSRAANCCTRSAPLWRPHSRPPPITKRRSSRHSRTCPTR